MKKSILILVALSVISFVSTATAAGAVTDCEKLAPAGFHGHFYAAIYVPTDKMVRCGYQKGRTSRVEYDDISNAQPVDPDDWEGNECYAPHDCLIFIKRR